MRILIVSDTHRKNENYFKLIQLLKPLDMVIHCGDSEGGEFIISESAECLTHMVLGNNDFFSDLPREVECNIGKYKVWITHGHNYYVSMGNEHLKKEARAKGVDIVIFGHTHKPMIDIEKDLITVNPGSLSYPRQEGHRPSYVLMEIDRMEEAHFTIAYL